MRLLNYIKQKQFILSSLGALTVITVFGSVEVVRRAPLTLVAQIAMLVLFLVVGLFCVKRGKSDWILYLYVFIQPLTRFPIYVLGPFRLSFVLLGLSILASAWVIWKKKNWYSVKIGKLIVPQLIFLGTIILSTLINITHIESFEKIVLHISNFLFVFVLLQTIDSSHKLARLVSVWYLSVVALAIFGVLASLAARLEGTTRSPFIQTSIDGIIRIQSLTPDSNYFAVLLLIPLAIGLAFLLSGRVRVQKKYRVFFWITTPIILSVMFLTYSRAGLLALGIVLLSFVFFEKQFTRYVFWVKFGTIILASILICLLVQPEFFRNMILRLPDSVISQDQKIQYGTALTFDKSTLVFKGRALRLVGSSDQTSSLDRAFQENIADDAIDVRGLYWGVAWDMFQDHPIIGLGAGQYPYNFERYLGYSYFAKLPNTHSIFLETMAEFGIIGLLALFFLLVRSLLVIKNLYRFAHGTRKAFLYAIGVAFVASVAQYAFQPSFNSMNLWLILGIVGILEVLSIHETKKLNSMLTQGGKS